MSSIQFKRKEGTDDFYFIEANVGRSTLNMPVAEACGIELQYTIYCDCADLPLPEARFVSHPEAKCIVWHLDLKRALQGIKQGELSVADWLRSLSGPVLATDVHWDDPKVIWAKVLRGLRKAKLKTVSKHGSAPSERPSATL